MNNQWKSFLESQSALISDEGIVRFDNADHYPACVLFDLSQLGLIRVSGEDAQTFLQGQFTNDTRDVTENRSQLSAYCSPKGRMLANFRVFQYQGDYMLQMPHETLSTVVKRLPMFILMSKAKVTNASDEFVTIGIAGECAETLLVNHFKSIPAQPGDTTQQNDMVLIRMPGSPARFMIIGSPTAVIALWKPLAAEASPANSDYWTLLDIRAGIPTIYQETADAFVPQMTNMQMVDGVSFTKGCYTGQEVVARMKYLGKLKRRMYLASVDTDRQPKPGDELFAPGSDSGQGAGRVVDARPSPHGGFELLAVAEIKSFEENNLHLQSEQGPKLKLGELPYGFDE
ncbi:CAF17-like 4Fe-4S cluster assembly/insertion protein YgfZ [Sedimenticola selenatireducens]|uniref:Folate-binding protein YgfZ n=1 Tax=Sedimenticola selenatireducens TaxID=191960 RepID=A0A558DV82_9GAMM|nr:folate-binding protein YgfZ [Sedimenticola selenatireducens]TVO77639.1 folate-binding protein YgfZ [Sedimenticola selenatireducens]TVT64945.1 MAG: folate-binding protein YgfZ [Sedimenticola selenatireducens]